MPRVVRVNVGPPRGPPARDSYPETYRIAMSGASAVGSLLSEIAAHAFDPKGHGICLLLNIITSMPHANKYRRSTHPGLHPSGLQCHDRRRVRGRITAESLTHCASLSSERGGGRSDSPPQPN